MPNHHNKKRQDRLQDNTSARPAFATRRDVLIIAALAALALGLLVFLLAGRGAGGGLRPFALVSAGVGDATETRRVPLDTDTLVKIDAALPVQLEVRDGAIRFVHSVCPDHTCERFGWLRYEGDSALCAPAGVSVHIAAEG